MSAGRRVTLTALAVLGFSTIATAAHADRWDSDRDRKHKHHGLWEDWDNRRDARRAGVIAGTAAAGVAGAVARDNAADRYEECMELYAYESRYDTYCRKEYYRDRQEARRAARRTGVVVGLGVRAIVRD